MVMKVTGINNIAFSSAKVSTPDSFMPINKQDIITELNNVTPVYNITTPIGYKKIATDRLPNGTEMFRYKMDNGYKVTIVPQKGSPAVVKTYVNVGSMNETSNIKGISHFLEHMAFNGTNGESGHIKLNQGDSFKKIDKLGGWANASTNYAITDYVNSTPLLENQDLETQIQVLAAMTEDLKLSDNMIQKEKGPVSSEINMILDNPTTIAMDQTVRTLFQIKSPADELVGGSVAHIQQLTRQDVLDYYNTYYTPDNINIVITGDVNPQQAIELIAKNFNSKRVPKNNKFTEKLTPINSVKRKDFQSDKTKSAEIVLGFAGARNNDIKGQILYELAVEYLNSHEAGLKKELKMFNTVPQIYDEKISTVPTDPRLSFMSLTVSDDNSESALHTIFNNLNNIKEINSDSLEVLKHRIKQNNEEIYQYSSALNDCIGYAMLDNNIEYITNYNEILDSITKEEFNAALKEFFNPNKAAITVVHPRTKTDNTVSFKGKTRKPIDTEDIKQYKINNYDVGFYNTPSNNINMSLLLMNNRPYIPKAGVSEVLNEIYSMGTKNHTYNDFEKFKEQNNISVSCNATKNGMNLTVRGDVDNYVLGFNTAKELLYNPNITEENLQKAKEHIKDRISRTQINSLIMQQEFENKLNPYSYTRKEVRENLDNITVEDVEDLHNYIIKNSRGIMTANIPKSNDTEVRNNILKLTGSLAEVQSNTYKTLDIYKEIKSPVVLTKANHNSQADITETFRFKYNDTVKEKAILAVLNSILSSSSIGLFDNLREKQNLAYSVHSNITTKENIGRISLNILTTTDNKDIGEYSYANLQKSVDGFNKQISELVNGKFTEEDLEIAKRSVKASLLDNEGIFEKIYTLETGLNSPHGILLKNKVYNEIDKITADDIIKASQTIFASNPVYTITATQDTLDANKDYLDRLKISK